MPRPPHPLRPGDPETLGGHRLLGRLGEGGEGVVYLARARSAPGTGGTGGDLVAIKLFHAPVAGEPSLGGTVARELAAAQQVARFCTAQVLGSGTVDDRPYIVSEYVDGPSLHEVVQREGPRSGSALDRLAVATATALVALHDAGVVHRDFKPHNVLLGSDGPRVVDFGISRALSGAQTMVSRAVGTPAYMAPEQLQPGPIGPAVDVFAWASTMVFTATGHPPFGNESIPIVLNRIAHGEPDLGRVEEPLRGLLAACLTKDPAGRPTAQQVLDRLVRRTGGRAPEPAVPAAHAPPAPPAPPVLPPVPAGPVLPGHAQPNPMAPAGPPGADATTLPRPAAPAAPAGHAGRGRSRAVLLGVGAAAVAVIAAAGVHLFTRGGSTDAPLSPAAASQAAASIGAERAPSGAPSRPRASTASPSASRSATVSASASTARATKSPSQAPKQRVELGAGHFTEYCQSLGWEWVEWKDSPRPGAYCVKRKGDIMYLTAEQRDAGCRWRFKDARARHYFKGKSNYCYTMR
ncbi:serine/threonine protein kinase [Actinomadura viridis]|uniref:serine/threonine protein kinase n=1 Tax=Actinomadura viridis TaxID=58110 RepID=UPI00369A27EC